MCRTQPAGNPSTVSEPGVSARFFHIGIGKVVASDNLVEGEGLPHVFGRGIDLAFWGLICRHDRRGHPPDPFSCHRPGPVACPDRFSS